MPTIPMKSEVETLSSGSASGDRLERENAVVFRGDGEPQSADLLLGWLAEIQSESGLSPDNYSLGGSVADLENHFSAALGKESAIYMPTGTLANHLAIRALCGGKPRAIVQEQSHLYHDCGDCVTQLSGINLVPLAKGECCFTLEELKDAVTESTSGRVLSSIGAVMIESNPDILNGLPCIAGTRIPARAIKAFHEDGHTTAEILLEYPSLTAEKIEAAVRY